MSADVLSDAGMAQTVTCHDLFWFEHRDHLDAGSADTHREKPAPAARVQIANLVVHDVAAGFPKSLACNDFARRFPFDLEEDPALQYVAENRSGMTMRRESRVGGRQLDKLCHRMRTLWDPARGDAQKICDFGVA